MKLKMTLLSLCLVLPTLACEQDLLRLREEFLFVDAPRIKGAAAEEFYLKLTEHLGVEKKLRIAPSETYQGQAVQLVRLDSAFILTGADSKAQTQGDFEILLDPRFWKLQRTGLASEAKVITLEWDASGRSSWKEDFSEEHAPPKRRSTLETMFLQMWPTEYTSTTPGLEGTPLPRGMSVMGSSVFEHGYQSFEIEEVNFWMSHHKESSARVPYTIIIRMVVRNMAD
jgi:hypothetical protein